MDVAGQHPVPATFFAFYLRLSNGMLAFDLIVSLTIMHESPYNYLSLTTSEVRTHTSHRF